ncbi:MAG: hypothetical protein R3245_04905 [Kiloniellales bacterium]|nr:hypothetical protein [Kiloniellales bacterium]
MTDEVSYFEVASFLADIEPEYADAVDPTERTGRLVDRLLSKWPFLTAQQAVAYVQVFNQKTDIGA